MKLRPPKILIAINRTLICTFAVFVLLFTFDSLNLANNSKNYTDLVETTEEAYFLQQSLRMAFDSILLKSMISGLNLTTDWSEELEGRT